MILYNFPFFEDMAQSLVSLLDISLGSFSLDRMQNGDICIELMSQPQGEVCCVLGSFGSSDSSAGELLQMCRTLKRASARRVIALLPYLPYLSSAMQSNFSAELCARQLSAHGADEVVTVDAHWANTATAFPIPLRSVSPAHAFAEVIRRTGWKDATLVAPDAQHAERVCDVRQSLHSFTPVMCLHPVHSRSGARHFVPQGDAIERAVLISDVLDTGEALLSCCDALHCAGTRQILLLVTHGLFNGSDWRHLHSSVKDIWCTNTVPLPEAAAHGKVNVVSITSALANSLNSGSDQYMSAFREPIPMYAG